MSTLDGFFAPDDRGRFDEDTVSLILGYAAKNRSDPSISFGVVNVDSILFPNWGELLLVTFKGESGLNWTVGRGLGPRPEGGEFGAGLTCLGETNTLAVELCEIFGLEIALCNGRVYSLWREGGFKDFAGPGSGRPHWPRRRRSYTLLIKII